MCAFVLFVFILYYDIIVMYTHTQRILYSGKGEARNNLFRQQTSFRGKNIKCQQQLWRHCTYATRLWRDGFQMQCSKLTASKAFSVVYIHLAFHFNDHLFTIFFWMEVNLFLNATTGKHSIYDSTAHQNCIFNIFWCVCVCVCAKKRASARPRACVCTCRFLGIWQA